MCVCVWGGGVSADFFHKEEGSSDKMFSFCGPLSQESRSNMSVIVTRERLSTLSSFRRNHV